MNDEEIMNELIVENYWLNRANDSLIDENRNYEKRIDKSLEYLKRLKEKELITEFETEWLIELLEGSDKE
ncbi:MAG: hypothetical protein J6T10_08345 [Methanobrevibacter sp.]|nr:hypothetical protein [Methanobrevibacter sp.]